MPAATITIDDVSPLIDYQPAGAWRPGNDSMTNKLVVPEVLLELNQSFTLCWLYTVILQEPSHSPQSLERVRQFPSMLQESHWSARCGIIMVITI